MANPEDRKVNLGILKVNEKVKRVVPIINNSLAPIEFCVLVTPYPVVLQNSSVLNVAPRSVITMKPNSVVDLVVNFCPKSRIEKFSEEVGRSFFEFLFCFCYATGPRLCFYVFVQA